LNMLGKYDILDVETLLSAAASRPYGSTLRVAGTEVRK
jgi:hypothetical protein